MEEIREQDEQRRSNDDDRVEYSAAAPDDEVPFHIPRD
jgi:hypothetical protein